jgi:DnaK suppressor protein
MSVDVDRLRSELLQERARVRAAIANLRDSDDEVEELKAGSDDALEENSEQVLAEVDAALRRIDEGSYGSCTACGKEIAPARLEARPWAALCIDDARKAERR